MRDIYSELHEFNGELLKELIYSNWEGVKGDLINFINSLTSVKQECDVKECSENKFRIYYKEEGERIVLTKEQFFEFLSRVIYDLYVEEMIMFNCFAMDKIFGVSRYYKNK